ncbi:MAG: hypothetical protein ACTSR8_18940 [Promethearchaeota archaeon]
MTITTRESINYQFSLIFGYSSPNDDLIVGDVVGPGRLTREKVNELSVSVIKFFRMYNAILRDYTGSELFSIEFNLHNYDEKDAQLKIYPKSMFLIPGKYKDCESLLLALRPETGYLDTHKSRSSVNNICELFFEVEEFSNRPELKPEEKQKILKKFSFRFSQKLYGSLIEDKWNKKLIGVSTSLPTEKKMLNVYAESKSDIDLIWHKRPAEIIISNPKYTKIKTPFEGQAANEHLKYVISEPSMNFIIENTLKLGNNLMYLVNTGTIDEIQNNIISYIIKHLKFQIDEETNSQSGETFINNVLKIVNDLERFLNKYIDYSQIFLKSGESGNLEELTQKFKKFTVDKGKLETEDFSEIAKITVKAIKVSISKRKDIRAIELESILHYLAEIIKNCINIVRSVLPKYLSRRRLKTLLKDFMDQLNLMLDNEQKPAKVLGKKFLEKFNDYINNQIEINPFILEKSHTYNEEALISEFKSIVNNHLEEFFSKLNLDIGDLVSFAEVMMEKDNSLVKSHIEKFKKFSGELHYLLSYILRYSTITRYIKEEPDKEISDPVSFSNRFHRFLEKRVGAINLEWKHYILDWIKDYSKKFFNMPEQRHWSLHEIYNDFLNYLEQRKVEELKPENFINFLDTYIAKLSNSDEKDILIELLKQYELSVDIKTEFPKYIKQKIKDTIDTSSFESERTIPLKFFSIDEKDTFKNYLKEMELKYFSKLIPQPITLILKHNLSNEEKELFRGELFHVINFRFWHDNLKIEIADNFKEVYREWMKEL